MSFVREPGTHTQHRLRVREIRRIKKATQKHKEGELPRVERVKRDAHRESKERHTCRSRRVTQIDTQKKRTQARRERRDFT